MDEDSRYLACSRQTRSELVVFMEHEGQIVAKIDVDSDLLDPFTPRTWCGCGRWPGFWLPPSPELRAPRRP